MIPTEAMGCVPLMIALETMMNQELEHVFQLEGVGQTRRLIEEVIWRGFVGEITKEVEY